ncbi:ABC transporter permease [Staphylococcus durrellii]|uniref:ABC transporter permease n=1 Tax=Staphylococcus durrellii TaxID=2781773 RepID=UPI00189DDF72|nr:ABC transporter permease [Staphylococcus durrellii]MBF7016378.1 ABC transporter permease [Staphylococcus durrellii]
MDRFFATFALTYRNKVKAKSFLIFTGIVVILILAAGNINKIIDLFNNGGNKIGIVTNNDNLYKAVKSQEKQLDDDATFQKVSKNKAKKDIRNKKMDEAYVANLSDNKINGKILSRDTVSAQKEQKYQAVLSTIQTQIMASNLNLSPSELKSLQAQSNVSTQMISDQQHNKNLSEAQKTFNMIVVYAGIMLLFFIIINYANQIAMEIATEKTSRVIEMIITSVSPMTHILAKIAGVIAVALTQIAIFVIVALISYIAFDVKEMFDGFDVHPGTLTTQIIIVGIINLIVGVLSYVFLAAILGAITSRIEDINQSIMPMSLLSMIGLYVSLYSVWNPDALITKITSFIPMLSPFVMFVRSSSPNVEIWEIVLSVIISLITGVILLWIAIRSYKDSILSFDRSVKASMKRLFNRG